MLALGGTLGSSSSRASVVGVGVSAGSVRISRIFISSVVIGSVVIGSVVISRVGVSRVGISSVGISSVGIGSVGIGSVGIVFVVLASSIDLLLGQDLACVGQGRGGGLDAGGGSGRLLDGGLLKDGTVTGGGRAADFRHVSVSDQDHSQ